MISALVASLMFAFGGALFAQSNAPQYTVDQAKDHTGEFATVSGTVTEVYVSAKGNVFLDFGGSYPHQAFTGVIFSRYAGRFSNVSSYTGKNVAVTGKITLYAGRPEIIVKLPAQLNVE